MSEDKITKIKDLIVNTEDQNIRTIFEHDLKDELQKLEEQRNKLKVVEGQIDSGELVPHTHEQFIELMSNLHDEIAKTTDMKQLDYQIRKIFLNFTVKDGKVLMHTLQSPFKEFLENGIISNSRGTQN